MRDDTNHCRRVVPNLPNIMSRERLGTQSRGATSRLVTFTFYSEQKSIGTGSNDCVQASLTESGRLLMRVAFAAFNRKRFCRGPNWDSTHEDVERKPKGVKSSSCCMHSHVDSVVPPTRQARQNGYTCEDRTTERTWHPNAKAETQDRNRVAIKHCWCEVLRVLHNVFVL